VTEGIACVAQVAETAFDRGAEPDEGQAGEGEEHPLGKPTGDRAEGVDSEGHEGDDAEHERRLELVPHADEDDPGTDDEQEDGSGDLTGPDREHQRGAEADGEAGPVGQPRIRPRGGVAIEVAGRQGQRRCRKCVRLDRVDVCGAEDSHSAPTAVPAATHR